MRGGFTLVELLIVIAIIAVLGTAVVVILNPVEYLRESRDSNRLNDTKVLESSLFWLATQEASLSYGSSNVIYLSLSDASATCSSYSLPILPSGWSYSCKPEATFRKVDGSGWIPVDFTAFPGGPPMSRLPVDPRNTSSNSYYAYAGNTGWHFSAVLESSKYMASGAKDGGLMPTSLERGSNLRLAPFMRGMIGYWGYDNNTDDLSGVGNNDIAYGGASYAGGLLNEASVFDGVNDYMEGTLVGTPLLSSFSVSVWFKTPYGGTAFALDAGGSGSAIGINTTGGQLSAKIMDAGVTNLSLVSASIATDNAWHHAVLTFDNATLFASLYLDGEVVTSGVSSAGIVNNSAFSRKARGIGSHWGYYQGSMDQVRLWNRVLSPAEVSLLHTTSN